MTFKLSQEQYDHIQESWRVFDVDEDGLITAGDLRLVLQSFGRDYEEAELESFLTRLPINFESDGAIDFPQFLLWMVKLAEHLEGCAQQRQIDEENAILASIPDGPANESAVIKKEKVRAMRLERSKLSEVAEACRVEEERRTFALFDNENKGFISWEDLNRVMQQSGERWSSEVLDDMMMAVVPPGQERRVSFEMFQTMLRAPVCWDEREEYDCQKKLNESLERARLASQGSSRFVACCWLWCINDSAAGAAFCSRRPCMASENNLSDATLLLHGWTARLIFYFSASNFIACATVMLRDAS
jgi:Ca2+-binding EF-hand superfamily protein